MSVHESHKDVIVRLKRANGHLTSVIMSIEAGKKCIDVAQQLHAVSNALIKAKQIYIRDHIDHCLTYDTLDNVQSKKEAIDEFREITRFL